VLLELAHHAPLLQLVDLDDRVEQLEVVARVARELLERVDVLREARAAEADAGLEELGPMRSSRPIPLATSMTSAPVSSQTLAISLMNEIFVARNALAASLTISADAMSVRTSSPVASPPSSGRAAGGRARRPRRRPVAVVADHDAVGAHEVADGRALLEELGARHVAEAGLAALAEDALDARARARRGRCSS
jgi:hypothetical protein